MSLLKILGRLRQDLYRSRILPGTGYEVIPKANGVELYLRALRENPNVQVAYAKITDASGIDAQERKWNGSTWVDGTREWDSDTAFGVLANPLDYDIAVDDLVAVAKAEGGKWFVLSCDILTMIAQNITNEGDVFNAIYSKFAAIHAAPFAITLNVDCNEYSVTGGRIWTRDGDSLDVSGVSGVSISATRWLYVPVTIAVNGTESAGVITEGTSEPDFWDRNGSNQTVINCVIGRVDVSAGRASVVYNNTGDIILGAQAGQQVAVNGSNNPGYLYSQFNDTASYSATQDLLVKLGNLEGSAPSQKLRLFVDNPIAGQTEHTSGATEGLYLLAWNGSAYRKISVNNLLKLVSDQAGTVASVLTKTSGGTVGWKTAAQCDNSPV